MEVDDIISYHDVVTAEIRGAHAARRNGLRISV